MIRTLLAFMLWGLACAAPAQEFSGLARLDAEASTITDHGEGIRLNLMLSQGVPYRVFTLDEPRRLVLDFREVDWTGVDASALDDSRGVRDLRVGGVQPGWSRMVLDLAAPFGLDSADMRLAPETGIAELTIDLQPATEEAFAAAAGAPETPGWGRRSMPDRATAGRLRSRQDGARPLRVVLDPGHGGIDPGAEEGELREKDMMLRFARELEEVLLRAGGVEVTLTRPDDRFVSLERRVTIAHRANADLFLSLHADALTEGYAEGATVYTLSDNASDAASAALAERHDRADLLAGIDLSGQDDVVADVLMDLARLETEPRAERLAEIVRETLQRHGLPLNTTSRRAAGFSVLKSPNVPSVLLELGFLTSERDRENLADADWRRAMAEAVRDAILEWRAADAAAAGLARQ